MFNILLIIAAVIIAVLVWKMMKVTVGSVVEIYIDTRNPDRLIIVFSSMEIPQSDELEYDIYDGKRRETTDFNTSLPYFNICEILIITQPQEDELIKLVDAANKVDNNENSSIVKAMIIKDAVEKMMILR